MKKICCFLTLFILSCPLAYSSLPERVYTNIDVELAQMDRLEDNTIFNNNSVQAVLDADGWKYYKPKPVEQETPKVVVREFIKRQPEPLEFEEYQTSVNRRILNDLQDLSRNVSILVESNDVGTHYVEQPAEPTKRAPLKGPSMGFHQVKWGEEPRFEYTVHPMSHLVSRKPLRARKIYV